MRILVRRTIALHGSALLFAALALTTPTIVAAHDDVTGSPDVTIRIDANGVSDDSVAIEVGNIVAFVNQDDDRHRMRSRTRPGEFDTGDIEAGERSLVRFTTTGTVRYADERSDGVAYAGEIVVGGAGDAGGAGDPGDGEAAAPGSDGGDPAVATSATVTIVDRAFSPPRVTVAAGGTVTWRNEDDRAHTATSSGGGAIDSPVLDAGTTYRASFAAPGTYAYLCAIHPEMQGTVEVVAATGSVAGGSPADAPQSSTAPAPDTAAVIAPTPVASASPAPAAIDGEPTEQPVPVGATSLGNSAPSAAVGDGDDIGGLAVLAIVVAINLGACALFMRTIGGAATRR